MIVDSVSRVCTVALLVVLVGVLGVGVYKAAQTEPVAINAPQSVTIGWGDTFWSIAREYYPNQHTGKAVEAIRQLNPGIDPGRLQVGQMIQLPREV